MTRHSFNLAEGATRLETGMLGDRSVSIRRPVRSEPQVSYEERRDAHPWRDLWSASSPLANKLLERQGRGRRALELGCGLGHCTIAATLAGFRVLATDRESDALDFTRENVHRNLGVAVETRMLDWRSPPNDLGQFDLVFGSDVMYESEHPAQILSLLSLTIAPNGVALIANQDRKHTTTFLAGCTHYGVELRRGETTFVESADHRERVDLLEVARKADRA